MRQYNSAPLGLLFSIRVYVPYCVLVADLPSSDVTDPTDTYNAQKSRSSALNCVYLNLVDKNL